MTRVKICGITRPEDAQRAVELGAWALGLIFWPQSRRRCPLDVAQGLGAQLRRRVELAGVFVNAPLDELTATAELASLSLVQLHGDEGPAYAREVERRTGARVIKSVRVRSAAEILALQPFHTAYHLLDAYSPRTPGGTGESFDWTLARLHPGDPPLILSGGLTPDNVGEAIAQVRPFAVDSASGTEADPGRKDPAKLDAFFDAVASAPSLV